MLNEKDFLEVVSKAIRKRRMQNKLSCEKLAELSEVDYSSVNLIENSKQTPRSYTLYKILHSLDIDITIPLTERIEKSDTFEELINKISLLDEDNKKALLVLVSNFIFKLK
ncbi:MAG: helix-turn-helix transcriptional regulator [Azospirillum sp.]|nr:helix-turn-helix transcriptional regulator [Azospirillum sp.]